MRPVDTEAIEAEIDELVQQQQSLKSELDEIDDLKGALPGLEEERTRLQDQIDEKQAALEAKEEELEAADTDLNETR